MQFELLLGFLLVVQVTKIHNFITHLYAKYKDLYGDIIGMLSSVQTEKVEIHDGIFSLDCTAPTGFTHVVGIINGVVYWTNVTSDREAITDGVSNWNVGMANWTVVNYCLTKDGWLVMYRGDYGTVEANKLRFKLYDTSFVAAALDLTVDGTNVLRSCKYVLGYDGTNIYCMGDGDFSEYIVYGMDQSNKLVYYATAVINGATGVLSFLDSKLGLIWGSDFYPIDDTFIYASKPIYTPFLFGLVDSTRSAATTLTSGLFPCNVGGVYGGMDVDMTYFDGTYIYRPLFSGVAFSATEKGNRFAFMQKQIL